MIVRRKSTFRSQILGGANSEHGDRFSLNSSQSYKFPERKVTQTFYLQKICVLES